jgi:hypothetical protein
MVRTMLSRLLLLPVIALAATLARAEAEPIGSLKFIGAATVPNDKQVDGTLVGGLSGLDYDPADGTFVAVSDDRSDNAPARFYTLKLIFIGDRLLKVDVQKAATLLQANGQPYPNGRTGGDVPDPESIRIDPTNPATLWWTSEGDRARGLKPFVRTIDRSGKQLLDVPVPAMFAMNADRESGGRNNLTFEGLSFAPAGASFWVGMESALYEDGPIATVAAGSVSRFTRFARDGKVLGQFAYPIDAIPARPGAGKAADNGVSEILALDDQRLLVIERSGVQGDDGFYIDHIRLYEASIAGATDISGVPALTGASYKPMTKRLVLNLDNLYIGWIDNIEGVTWGPKLSNGNRTLILVSDNNFNVNEVTQFLAFEVLP